MKIKLFLASTAAFAALAGAAHAGVPVSQILTVTPEPSNVGQSVTLYSAQTNVACAGPVNFLDDGNGQANLCSTVAAAGGIGVEASCSASFPTAGARQVIAEYTAGTCPTQAVVGNHTVNAAAVGVPTLAEWSMWGLAGMLLIGGGAVLARRSQRSL